MAGKATSGSRVTGQGVRLQTSTAFPELRLTEEDVKKPATLQRVLTQMWQSHKEVSKAHRNSSRMRATTFESCQFAAGVKFSIQHGFGTKVRYAIVGWQGAAGTTLPAWTVNDGTTLTLIPDSTGVADLEIWPV